MITETPNKDAGKIHEIGKVVSFRAAKEITEFLEEERNRGVKVQYAMNQIGLLGLKAIRKQHNRNGKRLKP